MDARTPSGSVHSSSRGPEVDGPEISAAPDLAAVFEAAPGINLLLAADEPRFTMLAASDERLAATLTTREETLGRPLFEVFSDANPENGEPSGVANLRASLAAVLRTRAPHRMAVQRYDLQRQDGTWEVRYWSPLNIPVLGPGGAVRYILHHVEDVTEAMLRAEAHDRLRDRYSESEVARQELEDANARLQEQQLELEMANQQLQEQAAELEEQAESLRSSAGALEQRTEDAERARAAADQATLRLAFLADASERLAASLDYETTLHEILALAVPMVADWALYTVDAGDGTIRILGSRHAEASKETFITETARRYPIRTDEPAGAAKVLRTGEPELIPEVPDEVLQAVARDPAHLEMLRAVGFRSLMTVPVSVQGRVLGALGFVTGASGRLYGPDDLTFALELARRAATALDQARLFSDAQAARREAEAEREAAEHAAARTSLLQSLTDALSRTLTREDVAAVVLDRVAATFGAHLGVLALVTREGDRLAVAAPERLRRDTWDEWHTFPLDTPVPLAEAARERRVISLPSLDAIAAHAPAIVALCREYGTEAMCVVPVIDPADRVLGALGLSFPTARELDAEMLALLETIARQAALALERAGLLEAAQSARWDAEAAEARLRDVFEQAPVAVAVLTGPEHVYTVVSPPYAASPGTGRPLLGRTVRDAFPEIAATGYYEVMDRVYQTGEPFSATERQVNLQRPGGMMEEHYFNIGYQPLRDASGQVYAIASVAYDVTEQVQARRHVEAARAEAERQRLDAQAANEAKSQFLSTMSHELRTPLNAIGGYTQLLAMGLRGPLTEQQQQDIERIGRANQHLMALVTDILNFTRLDAGQIEYRVADVELASVVADLEPLIAPQLGSKGIEFDHDGCAPDTPDQPHRLRADPEKLRQILLNLLTNAVKFTDAGGRVALACDTDVAAGVIQIRVSDTGRGIPAQDLERIFEPFVQVDRHSTQESQQGVGLGLAISRELARGMNGDVTVESVLGKGSTFTLTLPRA